MRREDWLSASLGRHRMFCQWAAHIEDPQRAPGAVRLLSALFQQGFQGSGPLVQILRQAVQRMDFLLDQFPHLCA